MESAVVARVSEYTLEFDVVYQNNRFDVTYLFGDGGLEQVIYTSVEWVKHKEASYETYRSLIVHMRELLGEEEYFRGMAPLVWPLYHEVQTSGLQEAVLSCNHWAYWDTGRGVMGVYYSQGGLHTANQFVFTPLRPPYESCEVFEELGRRGTCFTGGVP